MTLPVTDILPPIEPLLMVKAPICATQTGVLVDVPTRLMLFAVIVDAALLMMPRCVVVPPLKLTVPPVDIIICE